MTAGRRLPRIHDPHAVPVVAVDRHLPAPPAERLQIAGLRQRLAAPPAGWQAELPGDAAADSARPAPRAAAVLVPLVPRADGLQVLLTERTAHLRDHAGQISFPGGRCEPGDADAVATALRETEEEIGLPRRQVQVIGRLPDYLTVSDYRVTPVVALLADEPQLQPDAQEVAAVFEVPLAFLMNPAHHRRHRYAHDGVVRHFLSMPWTQPAPDGRGVERFIWGATAAMLRNLYALLAA